MLQVLGARDARDVMKYVSIRTRARTEEVSGEGEVPEFSVSIHSTFDADSRCLVLPPPPVQCVPIIRTDGQESLSFSHTHTICTTPF